MEWSIKDIMQPVITRLYIYGVNPIDIEGVFQEIEEIPLINAHALEEAWVKAWETKANKYEEMALKAEAVGAIETTKTFRKYVIDCDYAAFLINSETVDLKKAIYEKLQIHYREYTTYLTGKVKEVKIPFQNEKYFRGYLHLPNVQEKCPCIILFAGEGACKEELHTLARSFVKRGIAVLAWDTPGTGSSLFEQGIKTSFKNLSKSFKVVYKYVENLLEIDARAIGVCGLCMGGGYAYYAATQEEGIKCCINLFPLFITKSKLEYIPRWVKEGNWANAQRDVQMPQLLEDLRPLAEGIMKCDYLIVHGKHDNWMPFEEAVNLYKKAEGPKKLIAIEDEALYNKYKETMLHTMPVGEQMHWVKHIVADWAAQVLRIGSENGGR